MYYNFEVAKDLTGIFVVISNPTEGQYEKFREFKDLNSTYKSNFCASKKSYRLKLQNFLIGFADQVKAPTPVFPSRDQSCRIF